MLIVISSIVGSLLPVLTWVVPLLILATFVKAVKPVIRGFIGEFIVNLSIRIYLDKKVYHLFKNVMLPTADETTQIDHVIVSKFGIFVVETKNMSGWIFGGVRQKNWTQQIYRHKSKFQNPLHQNYKHVKTLGALLGLSSDHIHSVVVFIGESTFKTEMPRNVLSATRYINYIKSFREVVLEEGAVLDLAKMISAGRLDPSWQTYRTHVRHVHQIVGNKEKMSVKMESSDAMEEESSTPRCPKYGRPMILRMAKRGQHAGTRFWGCSGFPVCRGIMNRVEAEDASR